MLPIAFILPLLVEPPTTSEKPRHCITDIRVG